jgi:endonuclease/exonuclease/phosphatase family metal-dependent hydrolase
MRIATFNILNGRSPTESSIDEGRFVSALAQLDADVLALQEVDRNQPRSGNADLTALAADAIGARDQRFVAALAGTPGTRWSAATGDEPPDVAAYGIALLSRFPVVRWQVIRLPPAPVRVLYRFHGRFMPEWVRDEPRVCVLAEIDSPAGRIHVANTHLSFLPAWNRHQLRRLVKALANVLEPLVLLGDLNMTRGPAERITGMRPLATGLTFPASNPSRQIDHLLVRGELTAACGQPVDLPVSDHRALLATLEG